MDRRCLLLQLISGGQVTVGCEWNFPEHLSECGKVYLVHEGAAVVRHGGATYALRPGRVYLIPEATPLSFVCAERMRVDYVHFTGMTSDGVSVFHLVPFVYESEVSGEIPVEAIMDALVGAGATQATLRSRLATSGMLETLLSLFVTPESHADSAARSRVLPAVTYVSEHLGERITVRQLARLVGLERSHFTRLFSRLYGVSPSRFIHQRRVNRAKLLLRSSEATIGEIAEELGYSDGSHLWREFKEATGYSPTEYRASPPITGP